MPKFIDDPVGTVLGGIGAGAAGLGRALGFGGTKSGSIQQAVDQANQQPQTQEEVLKRLAALEQQGRFGIRGLKKGGKVKSASSRADGIAKRGKTRGKYI